MRSSCFVARLTSGVIALLTLHCGAQEPIEVHLVLQGKFATRFQQRELCANGVVNNAIVVNNGAFGVELDDFLSMTDAAIEDKLLTFARIRNIPLDTTDIMILDIEGRAGALHPSNLWKYLDPDDELYDPPLFHQIVGATRQRGRVAREIFPNARLAFHGTPKPNPRGDPTGTKYIKIMNALRWAARRGMFDYVDMVSPVLYPRLSDRDGIDLHKTYTAYTQLGIDGAREIIAEAQLRQPGKQMTVFPLLAFRVYNGSNPLSNWRYVRAFDPRLNQTLGAQIDVIRSERIEAFGFWDGEFDLEGTDDTMRDYLRRLFERGDFDGDDVVTPEDILLFSPLFERRDDRADITCDCIVNADDIVELLRRVNE